MTTIRPCSSGENPRVGADERTADEAQIARRADEVTAGTPSRRDIPEMFSSLWPRDAASQGGGDLPTGVHEAATRSYQQYQRVLHDAVEAGTLSSVTLARLLSGEQPDDEHGPRPPELSAAMERVRKTAESLLAGHAKDERGNTPPAAPPENFES